MDHHRPEPIEGVDGVYVSDSTHKLSAAISVGHLDAEKVLSAYGKFGRYQMQTYCLLCIVGVIYSAEMMIMGFIATPPEFECDIKQPEYGPQLQYTVIDKCYVADPNNWTIACNDIPSASFKFNESAPHSTLNSEFNLVCRDNHWAQHASSLFMIGGLIATPVVTQLSDLYGRRFTFLIPLWTAVAAGIACSVAPTYGLFLFFRFVAGFGTAAFSTISWVLCCESVSGDFRSLIPFIGTFTWVFGIIIVGVLRIWIQNWRWLYFAISAPGLLTIFYYWLIPESLHWMITHKKQKGIRRYLKSSSRRNNMDVVLTECKSTSTVDNDDARTRTFIDVLKTKTLVFHLIVHCGIMVIMNITYWGLALFSAQLSEDSYTGYFISGFVEIPAALIGIALLVKFGRRTVTFWSLLLQGISMALAIIFPGPGTFEMIFPIAAKLFNSIAWASHPLLLAEMSPTSVRNVFYGCVGFVGETGSVLAPYLELLHYIDERAPQAVIALFSISAAVFVLTSPETKDRPMPEDLDQFDPGWFLKRISCCNPKPFEKQDAECGKAESDRMLPTIREEKESSSNLSEQGIPNGEGKKCDESAIP